MFYHSGAIIAPSLNSGTCASHVDKKSSSVNSPSPASLRRSTARLRSVRWNVYKMIRFNEEEVWRSFGFYKSLVKRFLRRFSAKLKPKDSDIWHKKLTKTAKDVEDFLRKKPKSNSTHHVNMLVHCLSKSRLKAGDVFDTSSKSEKDENTWLGQDWGQP